jgi:hypothetical protein
VGAEGAEKGDAAGSSDAIIASCQSEASLSTALRWVLLGCHGVKTTAPRRRQAVLHCWHAKAQVRALTGSLHLLLPAHHAHPSALSLTPPPPPNPPSPILPPSLLLLITPVSSSSTSCTTIRWHTTPHSKRVELHCGVKKYSVMNWFNLKNEVP